VSWCRSIVVIGAAWLCLVAIVATASAQPAARRTLKLAPGEQRIISGEGIDTISTGAPGIVDVRVTDDQEQVVIVGLAPGETVLLVIMQDGSRVEYEIVVSRIKRRRNIRLDFYFVQISREKALQLGLALPTSITGVANGGVAINASNTRVDARTANASIVTTLLPRLDLARDFGWAKILQQARVVTANGDEGQYKSGGEVNFRLANGLTIQVERIQFGTQVAARASYDNVTGRLELRINAEVSTLTAESADGLPGRTLSTLNTVVNLELGQSIALAGLRSDAAGEANVGIPLLSQIPILGYLFGSRSKREERVQNVIFVVPTLVDAVGVEDRDRVREAFEAYRTYGGRLEGEALTDTVGADVAGPPIEAAPGKTKKSGKGRRR